MSIPASEKASFVVSTLRKELEGRVTDLESSVQALISGLEETLLNQTARIADLEAQISDLQASLSAMTNIAYASMATGVIAIIIAVVSIMFKKK